ncbi:MAG TPA: glycosyl hydrolase family 28-related protein [Bacteroidales bacterium]|nr:glycosyl hydrolase family 28-related protein [Bacteroidales bacterium]
MKKQLLMLVFVAIAAISFAQTKNIVVEFGATSTAYLDLPSAIAAAPNGATVYIPGGLHTLSSNITISKQLHFRGDGFNPLTLASGMAPTISGSQLIFTRYAHYSSFEGINFDNQLTLQHTTADTSGYFYLIFNRCRLNATTVSSGGNASVGNITIYMNECVINHIECYSQTAESVAINNSIIVGNRFYSINQGYIKNSVILTGMGLQGASVYADATNNFTISNSIFYGGASTTGTNNTITNCLFKTGATVGLTLNTSNIQFQDWNLIFVNVPDASYGIGDNFHLQPGCLGIAAGTDGMDLGIYGGSTPWKENSIPASPNVYTKSVDTRNNPNGQIDVMYKVKAQSN